jgi:hypothetical protein
MPAILVKLFWVLMRLIHVGGGVFWAGTAIFSAYFLAPSVREAGPEGGKVMQGLMQRGMSQRLSATAGATFLSGLILYLRHWRGNLLTLSGLVLLLGVLTGTASFIVGSLVGRTSRQMATLGAEMAAGGGPPDPEKGRQMGELQAKMGEYNRITAILLIITVICMGIWRYL